jgi:hypothetical protein
MGSEAGAVGRLINAESTSRARISWLYEHGSSEWKRGTFLSMDLAAGWTLKGGRSRLVDVILEGRRSSTQAK